MRIRSLSGQRPAGPRRAASPTLAGTRPTGLKLAAVATLAASLAFVSACSGDSDGDGTSTPATNSASANEILGPVAKASGAPVKIGLITDGASQVADLTVQNEVAEATAKYINEHQSGIAGRPIELVTCETLNDPSKAADCGNEMVNNDVAAVLIGTSGVVVTAWEPLNDAKIPVMLYGSGEPGLLASQTTFSLGNPTFPVIDLPIQVAKDQGNKKVTAVVIDVPAALHSAQEVAPGLFEKAGIGYELIRIAPGTADMTPQMQQVISNDSDEVFIIGNDSFCISAMNGLKSVGFTGTISSISQCITDATRKAVSGDTLEGITISASAPLGTDNPSMLLYKAVAETYGEDIDLSNNDGMIMFMITAGLRASLEGMTGDVTPETITATIKGMKETELPGAGGINFRCNGKADPEHPAVCVLGGLVTTLDDKGQPSEYKVLGNDPIPD
ncbi:ABC transporter substrate-binding protein [Frankia sp. CNm7]|uniref:ABC transporter substrate-binding protein n=1 Tax=Frankia nepalensis TaxID=1836974 RepID=A0A937RQ70_9ACTN|nr:ABC transporter substrate-binding protein [Frankia nepalensis]MBL7495906.1 ABC transporter substrate-binding protein [Frankia nepalensis]MBL7510367.1 ABC transporter substrate-binding protein [Frankia nepalensis]MBL7524179.1 ABC transporter substrate-binding protein [Frankia nepalensis]MBL7629966.1 ABC transporter substrate-binding protein [Frankia nepalensis]